MAIEWVMVRVSRQNRNRLAYLEGRLDMQRQLGLPSRAEAFPDGMSVNDIIGILLDAEERHRARAKKARAKLSDYKRTERGQGFSAESDEVERREIEALNKKMRFDRATE